MRKRGGCGTLLASVFSVLVLLAVALGAVWHLGLVDLRAVVSGEVRSEEDYERYARDRAEELIPHFEQRYFLQRLEAVPLNALCDIYEGALGFEDSVKFGRALDREDLTMVLTVLGCECPELWQLDLSADSTYVYDKLSGRVTALELTYRVGEGDYKGMDRALREALEALLRDLRGLEPLERERAVFLTIASRARYSTETDLCGTAYGALVEDTAKCDGFAAAFKWVVEELGETCLTVTADIPGSPVGHAWNVILVEGDWCRVDLTQSVRSEGAGDLGELGITEPICGAFNIADFIPKTDYQISQGLLRAAALPRCETMEHSFYAPENLVPAGEGAWERFDERLRETAELGGGLFILQYEDGDTFHEAAGGAKEHLEDWFRDRGSVYSAVFVTEEEYNVLAVKVEIH